MELWTRRVARRAGFAACLLVAGCLTGSPLLAQTAAADAPKPPEKKKIRVAVVQPFVAECTVNCGTPLTYGEIALATDRALDAAQGIEIVYTTGTTEGKQIRDNEVTSKTVWQYGGYPEPSPDLLIRKSKELDVDGVILVRFRWDYSEVKGDLYFVDGRISRVKAYDFSVFRVGRLNLSQPLGRSVDQMVAEASKVAGRQTVAVLEFEAENADTNAALAMSEALRSELAKTDRFTVMEASEVAATLDRLMPTKKVICTAVECALEAGRLLGVSKVVAGRVTGVDANSYKISVIQVDVATGETIASETTRHKGSLGGAGRSMAPVAEELAVTASPEGVAFRYEQAKWRWKTGLVAGGVVMLGLATGYFANEVKASNDRQKDDRLRAESATTQAEFSRWSKKLDDEKQRGMALRNQTIFAELTAAGLIYWGWSLYRHPPELTPVAWEVQPSIPIEGGIGMSFAYRW